MEPARLLGIAIGLVGLGAWIVVVLESIRMLRHRLPGRSLFWFATHGMAFFSGEGLTAAAEPHRQRFLKAVTIFFAAILAGALVGILQAA